MSKAELVSFIQNTLGNEVSSAQVERTVIVVIAGAEAASTVQKRSTEGFGNIKVAARKLRLWLAEPFGSAAPDRPFEVVKGTSEPRFGQITYQRSIAPVADTDTRSQYLIA